jgi:MarR family transcriptional regulator, 2-MHQ and catechol-resistance regulon repressor
VDVDVPACGIADERLTALGLLLEAHARLVRVLGEELERECGIPLIWYEVLLRIGRSPDGRMTMSELAREVSLTSGGLTRLADRIEAAGYVRRLACPSDRRVSWLSLTDAGRAKLDEATAVHVRGVEEHVTGRMSERERATLVKVLDRLRTP